MIDIDAAHHSWLVKEWHLVDGPWLTANLCTDLYQDLRANGPHVLSSADSISKHHLRWYWNRLQEQSLQIIIKWSFAFCTWQDEHHCLDAGSSNLIFDLGLPVLEAIRPDRELPWFVDFVADLVKALFHSFKEHGSRPLVLLTEEHSPSLKRGLGKHLGLNLAIKIRAAL